MVFLFVFFLIILIFIVFVIPLIFIHLIISSLTVFFLLRGCKVINFKLCIKPSKKNLFFFELKARQIIQSKKWVKSYKVISLLRKLLINWGRYYRSLHSTAYRNTIDYFIFKKVRSWVFRTPIGRNTKKQLFFPENRNWIFQRQVYSNRWVLFCLRTHKKNKSVENFLPKLEWIPSIKHRVLTPQNNMFDGDLLYWKQRFTIKKGEL